MKAESTFDTETKVGTEFDKEFDTEKAGGFTPPQPHGDWPGGSPGASKLITIANVQEGSPLHGLTRTGQGPPPAPKN